MLVILDYINGYEDIKVILKSVNFVKLLVKKNNYSGQI